MQEGEWLDAQPFLRRVCADLRVGELLHGPSFSLFDSTVAIEIGDVKMDIGLHRENQEAGSAEELIAGGAAPVQLSPPLLLAVLDKLLCLEATWHTGSMLPQTVFTSLYMLHPDRCVWGEGPCTHSISAASQKDRPSLPLTSCLRQLSLSAPAELPQRPPPMLPHAFCCLQACGQRATACLLPGAAVDLLSAG